MKAGQGDGKDKGSAFADSLPSQNRPWQVFYGLLKKDCLPEVDRIWT